jgi:T5SS/PEP-CTERM-associated repeat protein
MKTLILVSLVIGSILPNVASAQTTNVYSGVTVELTNVTYIGATNSFNQFSLINGASLSDTNGYPVFVGYNAGANNNSVFVSGSGTIWDQSSGGGVYVGDLGSGNSLTISAGAQFLGAVDVGYATVASGDTNGANGNSLLVTGSGTLLSVTFDLDVGQMGSGNAMTVSDGAVVDANHRACQVGENPGCDGNRVLLTGPDSTWTNVGYFVLGNSGDRNSMLISNGATLVCYSGTVGGAAIGTHYGSNNLVIVTDPASVWSMLGGNGLTIGLSDPNYGNSVLVSNGASLFSSPSSINGVSNSACVSGSGSYWSAGPINVGFYGNSGGGNSLTISNGASLSSTECYIGTGNPFSSLASMSDNNQITITGSGSIWTNSDQINVGDTGSGNTLLIADGATVRTANQLIIGANRCVFVNPHASNNMVTVANGSLIVTNSGGSGKLSIGVAGAGTNFLILNGGTVAANVLEVYSNSILTGCGTINGQVIIDPGGMVLANCGNLNFTGTVTNKGTMQAINSNALNVSGIVANSGVIDVINGSANFSGGLINNGTLLSASSVLITQASVSGQDVQIQIPSITGHTYRLQYTTSLTPQNWSDTGVPKAGTGAVLTFTDPSGITNGAARFYHVSVTTP